MLKLSTILALVLLSTLTANSAAHAASGKQVTGKFLGAKQTEYPEWFKESFLDFREDVAEAKRHNKRVMLVFHQDGCPYCNALVDRNLSQKDIETLMKNKFDVIAVNLWGDREVIGVDGKTYTEKTFAASLKVQFTPTILFFDETGRTILRLNGYIPPRRFKVALDYIATRQEQLSSYRDYVGKHLPPGHKGALHKEDFYLPAPYDLRRDKSNKPIAVFFEQRDCPNCDVLHSNVLVNKQLRSVVQNFDNIQLDMWSNTPVITPEGTRTTARLWAKQLDIKYAPTIVLFNNQGKEVIRSEAFFKLFHVEGLYTYLLDDNYKKQPSFQRYLSAKAEHLREQGIDVDIWHLDETK